MKASEKFVVHHYFKSELTGTGKLSSLMAHFLLEGTVHVMSDIKKQYTNYDVFMFTFFNCPKLI